MIELRGTRKIPLKSGLLLKVVKRYLKVKENVLITFGKSSREYGSYWHDEKKNIHRIKINYDQCKVRQFCKSKKNVEKYNIISTLLHEIRHIQQAIRFGDGFYDDQYRHNKDIEDKSFGYIFSPAELDAEAYALTRVLDAVKYYDDLCKKEK